MAKIIHKGKDFLIRYPQKGDEGALLEFINKLSSERTFITYQGEQLTLKEEREYLEKQLEKISKKEVVQLVVEKDGGIKANVSVGLLPRAENHVGSLAISVSKDMRGKGVGTLLLKLIIEEARKNLPGIRLITLDVLGNNRIARDLYLKFGFREHGLLPKGARYRGKFVDNRMMYLEL